MEIVFVLDETGSMQDLREDAVGGFNQFLTEQKAQPGDASLTLIQFSKIDREQTHRTIVSSQPLATVIPLTLDAYRPRGITPLWDAVGCAIATVKERNPDKAIFVILTDGLENASTEYTAEKVKQAVEECKARGWEFVYLGANQDAWAVGAQFGLARDQTANFTADAAGVRSAYSATSRATTSYRTGKKDTDWQQGIQ